MSNNYKREGRSVYVYKVFQEARGEDTDILIRSKVKAVSKEGIVILSRLQGHQCLSQDQGEPEQGKEGIVISSRLSWKLDDL